MGNWQEWSFDNEHMSTAPHNASRSALGAYAIMVLPVATNYLTVGGAYYETDFYGRTKNA